MSYGIPHPGVYIVDKNKKVQAKFFKDGYKDRPAVAEILAKIEQLNPPEIPPMTIGTMGEDPILPEEQFIETPAETLAPILTPENIEETATEIQIEIPTETAVETTLENPAEILDDMEPETVTP